MVMESCNISEAMVDVIRSLYEQSRSQVKIGHTASELCKPTVGVRKGCLLSTCFLSKLLKR